MKRFVIGEWRATLRAELRAGGWRGLLRKRGWRFVAAIVAFYLARDLLLYVALPVGAIALAGC
jgi:hypothetical protein